MANVEQFTDADEPAFEHWWRLLWVGWGLLVGTIVGWADRSLLEAAIWPAAGLVIGCCGMRQWQTLGERFLFRDDELDETAISSVNRWLIDTQLALLDPNRSPPGLSVVTVALIAPIHGLLLGSVGGALVMMIAGPAGKAWQGALGGCIGGPLLLCCMAAVVEPIFSARHFKGPSIEPIRLILEAAADEADRLGHEFLNHGHLLLAIIRSSDVVVRNGLQLLPMARVRLEQFVVDQIPRAAAEAKDAEFERSWVGVTNNAVQLAKGMGGEQVFPGHLLLSLMELWPAFTNELLQQVRADPAEARKQLLENLSAPDASANL